MAATRMGFHAVEGAKITSSGDGKKKGARFRRTCTKLCGRRNDVKRGMRQHRKKDRPVGCCPRCWGRWGCWDRWVADMPRRTNRGSDEFSMSVGVSRRDCEIAPDGRRDLVLAVVGNTRYHSNCFQPPFPPPANQVHVVHTTIIYDRRTRPLGSEIIEM